MSSVVDLKSMYSVPPSKYPNMMAIERRILGLDPKWVDAGFDPKRTMDFVLFGKVCYGFVLPSATDESVKHQLYLWEADDVKRLPSLEVILFDDAVSKSWGWKRLIPWMSGTLLFEDYFGYLERYYRQNENAVFASFDLNVGDGSASLVAAAAKKCMEKEVELNAEISLHGRTEIAQPYDKLSQVILDQARAFSNLESPAVSVDYIVPAACFMCITQEAELKIMTMSDKKSHELWQIDFDFGNKVREVALKFLINYRGTHSVPIAAAMLGMAEEYSVECKLLEAKLDNEHCDEMSEISQHIRQSLLELLFIIHDTFPFQSAINYDPIETFRTAMGNKFAKHLSEPIKGIASANEVSSTNIDEIASSKAPTLLPRHQQINEVEMTCPIFPKSPISAPATPSSLHQQVMDVETTSVIILESPISAKSAAPATPSSLSTCRSVNNYGFDDQGSRNYGKRKSIGGSQDSEAISTQPSEQRNDSGVTELGSRIKDDGAEPVTPGTETQISFQQTLGHVHFGVQSDDEFDEEKRNPKKSKSTGRD